MMTSGANRYENGIQSMTLFWVLCRYVRGGCRNVRPSRRQINSPNNTTSCHSILLEKYVPHRCVMCTDAKYQTTRACDIINGNPPESWEITCMLRQLWSRWSSQGYCHLLGSSILPALAPSGNLLWTRTSAQRNQTEQLSLGQSIWRSIYKQSKKYACEMCRGPAGDNQQMD